MSSRSERIRQLCAQVVESTHEEAAHELLLQLQREIRLHVSGIRHASAKDIPKWFHVDDSDLALFQ